MKDSNFRKSRFKDVNTHVKNNRKRTRGRRKGNEGGHPVLLRMSKFALYLDLNRK